MIKGSMMYDQYGRKRKVKKLKTLLVWVLHSLKVVEVTLMETIVCDKVEQWITED